MASSSSSPVTSPEQTKDAIEEQDPITTDVPETCTVRCSRDYPSFVKFFYNSEHGEEDMYLEFFELPQELRPRMENVLPFDFKEEAWHKNLTMEPAESDPETGEKEPSFINLIPMHYRDLYISPHVVVPGVFFMMLNAPVVKREKPLSTIAAVRDVSFRGTASVFEMYRLYRCVLFWFEGHFMMTKSKRWKERTQEVLTRHGDRIRAAMDMFRKKLMFIGERKDITYKVSHGQGTMLDYYSTDLAEIFGAISFDYAVSIINILELALMELMQFNIEACVKNKFLTFAAPPDPESVSPVVKHQVLNDLILFCLEVCNASYENKLYHYDTEHMTKFPTSTRWILSPSFFYQTFFFAVIGDALPESKEIDRKEKKEGLPNGSSRPSAEGKP
jgi:hypothetical protein